MNKLSKFAICAFVLPAGSLAAGIAMASPGSDHESETMTQQSQPGAAGHGSITTDRDHTSTSDRTPGYGTTDDTMSGGSASDRPFGDRTSDRENPSYAAGEMHEEKHKRMRTAGGSSEAEYMSSAPSDSVSVEKVIGKALFARSKVDDRDDSGASIGGDASVGSARVAGSASASMGDSDSDRNRGNENEVGNISDLLLDESGQVIAVVVDIGGFLGMGQHPVAISWDSIERRMNDDNDGYEFTVNATEDALRQAPEYDEDSDGVRVSSND